jgi:hypothetical protein
MAEVKYFALTAAAARVFTACAENALANNANTVICQINHCALRCPGGHRLPFRVGVRLVSGGCFLKQWLCKVHFLGNAVQI